MSELDFLMPPPPPLKEPAEAAPTHDEPMVLNIGPQHPSTHGVLRVVAELDGERIVSATPDIGYLHTGIEKECEVKTWQQVVPLTDRVDYLANLSNNLAYCLAVEKLLQLEIPPKAQWMRVMLTELTRINSHLVWLGTHVVVTDGSRVGRDAIIGAGAVVVGEIPEFAIAVGTPAKVLRDRRTGGAAPSPEPRAPGPEEA